MPQASITLRAVRAEAISTGPIRAVDPVGAGASTGAPPSNGAAESIGVADVARPSGIARGVAAALWMAGGFAGGGACIVIPIVHLFTTWALPLLGVLMGVRALRRTLVIRAVAGPCPACGQALGPVDPHGGNPAWLHCPRCDARLEVVPGAGPARPVHVRAAVAPRGT